MAEPVKFTFDRAFDGGAKSRYDLEIERLHEESRQAQTSSHAQGHEEGRQQALNEIEAATQAILEQVAQAAHALFSQQHQLESNLKQEMVQLAYTIASKLSPALIKTKPLAEVEALIEDCMVTAHKEPRLVVRVSESITEAVSYRLEDMKAATCFPGDIVLIGEEIENAVQRFVMSESNSDITNKPAVDDAVSVTDEPLVDDTNAPTQ